MKGILPLLLFVCFATACSARIELPRATDEPLSNDAVNINTASVIELERLPYIGRSTAESIVEFRQKNGPFRRPEELMLIRGVSETRFMEIRQGITVR
jgi:competence ComEA-like helix-hairpin-helix protein